MKAWALAAFLGLGALGVGGVHANGYEDARAELDKARAHQAAGRLDLALDALRLAQYWNDGYGYYAATCYSRGRVLLAMGRKEEAKHQLEAALAAAAEVDPQWVDPGYAIPEAEIRGLLTGELAGVAAREPAGLALTDAEVAAVAEASGDEDAEAMSQEEHDGEPGELDPADDPPRFFLGDREGIEIHSSSYPVHAGAPACDYGVLDPAVAAAGLIPTTGTRLLSAAEAALVTTGCELTPGTTLVALGPGWVTTATVTGYAIDADPFWRCQGQDKPTTFVLRARLAGLAADPLLVYQPREGEAPAVRDPGYRAWATLETVPEDAARKEAIVGSVGEYVALASLQAWRMPDGPDRILVRAEGRPTAEEGGTRRWYGLFASQEGTMVSLVEVEDDDVCGAEKLELVGVLDADLDGDLDVLVRTRAAVVVVLRHGRGYVPVRFGDRPCEC